MRTLVLVFIVIAVLVVAGRWGSFVAGGSDSYCYVHQAERWASGRLHMVEPLALDAPWPDAPLAFAPAGHRPSPTVPGAIAPVCPPGLSIAMVPFLWVGGTGAVFLVVPLFGVLLILATDAVGGRFGARIGVAAAALVAGSPIFLYQLVQPMSDVPAAALWMLAVACATGTTRRHSTAAGLAASAAIVVRPNLLPLGVVIGLFLLCRSERSWRVRMRSAAEYAACCVPGCLAVVAIQQALHGSPFASGYGPADELFALANVAPNATRYPRWLFETQTPLIAIAALAPAVLPGALTWLFASLVIVNLGIYLPYKVFDDWSFLRFLLPTVPLLLILLVAVLDSVCRRAGVRRTHAILFATTAALLAVGVREARDHNVFRLRQMEARFERAGLFVDRRLPANALVVTSWQSGSVRFYSGRRTLVWDGLPPEWLDRALAFVRAQGFEPYLLLESWEEPEFRRRFQGSGIAELDWPPMAEVTAQVRIYDPNGRDQYFRGVSAPTEYVR
jgi:hypothetical protein